MNDATGVARRILIVDDNQDCADILALMLSEQGHDVTVAYDGRTGLSTFANFHPDVALIDIGMPHLSGTEVASVLRCITTGQRALLIAISGASQEDDRVLAREAGFDHYLSKPFDIGRLNKLLASGIRYSPSIAGEW